MTWYEGCEEVWEGNMRLPSFFNNLSLTLYACRYNGFHNDK